MVVFLLWMRFPGCLQLTLLSSPRFWQVLYLTIPTYINHVHPRKTARCKKTRDRRSYCRRERLIKNYHAPLTKLSMKTAKCEKFRVARVGWPEITNWTLNSSRYCSHEMFINWIWSIAKFTSARLELTSQDARCKKQVSEHRDTDSREDIPTTVMRAVNQWLIC